MQLLTLELGRKTPCKTIAETVRNRPCIARYTAGTKAYLATNPEEAWKTITTLQLAGIPVEEASLTDPQTLTISKIVLNGIWQPKPSTKTDPLTRARKLVILIPEAEKLDTLKALRATILKLHPLASHVKIEKHQSSVKIKVDLKEGKAREAARTLREMQIEGLEPGKHCHTKLRIEPLNNEGKPVLDKETILV